MAQEKKDGLRKVEDSKLKEITGGQLYADSNRGNTEPEPVSDADLEEVAGGQMYADSNRGNTEPEPVEDDDKPVSHS